MAQPTQTLQFICRGCRTHLSKSSLQLRPFSSTTSRSKSIPSFAPTASPELDALLLDWRNRVFTPSSLSLHHQKLVYKQKHRSILENDPGVCVTMSNDEEVKLQPMDRLDRPSKSKSLNEFYRILATNPDDIKAWENLGPFLEGLTVSKQKPSVVWFEKITRKANELGKAGIIKHCAEMVKKTGLKLSYEPVTRQFMLGYHDRAVAAGFKGESMVKIAKDAESLVLLLEKPEHCGGKLGKGETDMRRSLIVVATLLELSAARATELHQGNDTDGSVSSYAKKLIAIGKDDVLQADQHQNRRCAIETYIVIANGIKMALQIQESSISKIERRDLEKMFSTLTTAIKEETSQLEKEAPSKPGRPSVMLKAIGPL